MHIRILHSAKQLASLSEAGWRAALLVSGDGSNSYKDKTILNIDPKVEHQFVIFGNMELFYAPSSSAAIKLLDKADHRSVVICSQYRSKLVEKSKEKNVHILFMDSPDAVYSIAQKGNKIQAYSKNGAAFSVMDYGARPFKKKK